jgi:NAD(P)-dependent dehydrogenase (short-subunit alcohol dehydrogenase family)
VFTSPRSKPVIVIGGTRGLDKGIAPVFASLEARVCIIGRHLRRPGRRRSLRAAQPRGSRDPPDRLGEGERQELAVNRFPSVHSSRKGGTYHDAI